MNTPARFALYKGYRFPPEIISHCFWIYYHFCLSLRDVSELMLARGVDVSRSDSLVDGEVRRRIHPAASCAIAPCGDTWHLDELCIVMNGKHCWLWRAVDQSGEVQD